MKKKYPFLWAQNKENIFHNHFPTHELERQWRFLFMKVPREAVFAWPQPRVMQSLSLPQPSLVPRARQAGEEGEAGHAARQHTAQRAAAGGAITCTQKERTAFSLSSVLPAKKIL